MKELQTLALFRSFVHVLRMFSLSFCFAIPASSRCSLATHVDTFLRSLCLAIADASPNVFDPLCSEVGDGFHGFPVCRKREGDVQILGGEPEANVEVPRLHVFSIPLRLGIRGTRTVVLAQTALLLEHLTSAGGGSPIQLAALNHWMKSATVESAKSFATKSGSQLFHCTVGNGDILSLPAGYVFYEKVVGNSDFVGVRMPILSLGGLASLTQINRHLLRIESPSLPLQRALDTLAIAE